MKWATIKALWFAKLVWFGLVGFSFHANLEPQLRVQKRARLAEDTLAHNASLGLSGTEYIPRIPDPTPGPHVRLNAGWSLADDVSVLRPGCPVSTRGRGSS